MENDNQANILQTACKHDNSKINAGNSVQEFTTVYEETKDEDKLHCFFKTPGKL